MNTLTKKSGIQEFHPTMPEEKLGQGGEVIGPCRENVRTPKGDTEENTGRWEDLAPCSWMGELMM